MTDVITTPAQDRLSVIEQELVMLTRERRDLLRVRLDALRGARRGVDAQIRQLEAEISGVVSAPRSAAPRPRRTGLTNAVVAAVAANPGIRQADLARLVGVRGGYEISSIIDGLVSRGRIATATRPFAPGEARGAAKHARIYLPVAGAAA